MEGTTVGQQTRSAGQGWLGRRLEALDIWLRTGGPAPGPAEVVEAVKGQLRSAALAGFRRDDPAPGSAGLAEAVKSQVRSVIPTRLWRDPQNPAGWHPADWIVAQQDPHLAVSYELQDMGDVLHMGMDLIQLGGKHHSGWVRTAPQMNALLLAPPRGQYDGGTGKSSAGMIPNVASFPGPVVSASTRGDVAEATALVRSRFGEVGHFAPDGETPTPPGLKQLRWSPLVAATSWNRALLVTEAMVEASGTKGDRLENGFFWTARATDVLAPLIYVAARMGKDMGWVRRSIRLQKTEEAAKYLRRHGPNSALEKLESATAVEPRQRDAIFGTATVVIRVYDSDAAVAWGRNPNFDPAVFVSGEDPQTAAEATKLANLGIHPNPGYVPHRSRADTIYIFSSGEYQKAVAPIVVGLLMDIRRARYALTEEDRGNGIRGRAKVLWALDEVAGIAPIPDLPEMLADCGGNGIVVMAGLQDLSYAERRWPVNGEAFLTSFQDKLVFAGGNIKTAETISKFAGKKLEYITTTHESESTSRTGIPFLGPPPTDTTGSGRGQSVLERDVLPVSAIVQGLPGNRDAVIGLKGATPFWTVTTPWYRAKPWPWVFVSAMEQVAAMGVSERCLLPIPPLLQDPDNLRKVDPSGKLEARFVAASEQLKTLAAQWKAENDQQSHAAHERAAAIARGEDPPPGEWEDELYSVRLLIGAQLTLDEMQALVAEFDPRLEAIGSGDWERTIVGGNVMISYDSELKVPDLWLGQAARAFATRPATSVYLSCRSDKGWSYIRDFARRLADRYPVMWFGFWGGGYNEEDVTGELLDPLPKESRTGPRSPRRMNAKKSQRSKLARRRVMSRPQQASTARIQPELLYGSVWRLYTAAQLRDAHVGAAVEEGFGAGRNQDGTFSGGSVRQDATVRFGAELVEKATDEVFDDVTALLGAQPRCCVEILFPQPVEGGPVTLLAEALTKYGPVVIEAESGGMRRIGGEPWSVDDGLSEVASD